MMWARAQRQPLLPRIQIGVWRIPPRLSRSSTHWGGPGNDADDLRAATLHCFELRHVRSAALHALVSSHRRRNSINVAPNPARVAQSRL